MDFDDSLFIGDRKKTRIPGLAVGLAHHWQEEAIPARSQIRASLMPKARSGTFNFRTTPMWLRTLQPQVSIIDCTDL